MRILRLSSGGSAVRRLQPAPYHIFMDNSRRYPYKLIAQSAGLVYCRGEYDPVR